MTSRLTSTHFNSPTCARIGDEQQLVGIGAVALGRRVRALHAIAVKRAGADIGQVAVPNLIGVFTQLDARYLLLAVLIEQVVWIGTRSGPLSIKAQPARRRS